VCRCWIITKAVVIGARGLLIQGGILEEVFSVWCIYCFLNK